MTAPHWRREGRFGRTDVRRDVDDELEFHIETLTEKYLRAGVAREEARRMAVKEFGDRERAATACVDIDRTRLHREQWRGWLDNLRRDVLHGIRRLWHEPTFTVVTTVTLGLGIGPTIAIFSILNNVLLRPLPFADPSKLVLVQETFPRPSGQGTGSVSVPNYLDWKAQNQTLDLSIANYAANASLQDAAGPERISVAAIDASVFPVLGVQPEMGRNFTPEETSPNGPALAILSDAFWRRRFNADPHVLGRTLVIDNVAHTVIGVMPPDIIYPSRSAAVDLWLPFQVAPAPNIRASHAFFVVGRLRPGVGIEQAAADMKQIADRLAVLYPASQDKRGVALTSYEESLVGRVRPQLLVLFGAAGFVLLIAAANAASLLLARAGARRRDIAVLGALGASRARIAQQFLVEGLLLSAAGGMLGLLMASAAVKGIVALAGTTLPRGTVIHFDWRVVAFIAGTILVTTILFALAPALKAGRADVQQNLREGRRENSGSRDRRAFSQALVIGQFALSLVLLAGAGLLLRSFAALLGTDTGLAADHVLTMRTPVPLGSSRYKTAAEALERFYIPMLDGVRAISGVESAGTINLLPLQQTGNNINFRVDGRSYASVSEQPFAEFRVVSPGYFSALRIPILKGRDVAATDRADTEPIALINDEAAKQLFPNDDPIGKQLVFGVPGPKNPPNTIVGVVGSVRQSRLDTTPAPELYFPIGQAGGALASMALVVRTGGDPAEIRRAVEAAIHRVDPDLPPFNVSTMDDVVKQSIADRELYLGLLASFAGIALLLAMAGVYGVMAYSVAQRTREFGIRLALGANLRRMQWMVVWQGARLALIGLGIGLPAALLLSRLLRSVLYQVEPGDPLTFAVVAALLGLISLVASYLPALRIVGADPMTTMRSE